MKRIAFLIVFVGLLTTACLFKPSANIDNTKLILANVEDKSITAADLDSLARMEGFIITDTTDVELIKKALLDSLIDSKLVGMLEDSIAITLESDLDFVESRNREVSNTVFRLMFQGEIKDKVIVDSSDVLAYYNDNKDKYVTPEQVKASHILIPPPSPDTAGVQSKDKKATIIKKNNLDTHDRALAVLKEAKAGANWDSLVVKYSQDATNNKKGGDLGYFARGRMVAAFDSASFVAEVGDIVGPVKTRFGYHIIKIDDHKQSEPTLLDQELKTTIQAMLKSEKEKTLADQFLDSLKADGKFEFNEEALAKEDSLVDPTTWVTVINTSDTVYQQRLNMDFPKYQRFHQLEGWTVDDKKSMLKEVATTFFLRSAGKVLGYYEKPEALKTINKFNDREATIRAINMLKDLEYKPTDEEIEAYYKDKFDELYVERKPLHVQHIIFEDSAKALIIRDSLVNGADFKKMALKYYPGELEIREVAYNLGFISEEELGDDFFNHIKDLEEGDISQPFKSEWGYHVVKLVNKRQDKKLNQVRPGIRKKLMEAANSKVKAKYLNEKVQEVVIKINDDAVKKYKFPESLYSIEINP